MNAEKWQRLTCAAEGWRESGRMHEQAADEATSARDRLTSWAEMHACMARADEIDAQLVPEGGES